MLLSSVFLFLSLTTCVDWYALSAWAVLKSIKLMIVPSKQDSLRIESVSLVFLSLLYSSINFDLG